MTNYKGYYIDNIIFHNTEEIDSFVKKQAVDSYKKAVQLFKNHSTLANSSLCDEKAERLVKYFGFTWEQVEALEIQVLQSIA